MSGQENEVSICSSRVIQESLSNLPPSQRQNNSHGFRLVVPDVELCRNTSNLLQSPYGMVYGNVFVHPVSSVVQTVLCNVLNMHANARIQWMLYGLASFAQ